MDMDEASRRAQARLEWSNFIQSRLQDAESNSTGRIKVLDWELELLDDFSALVRKRRNAHTWIGRLPVELLSAIFAILRGTWSPKVTRRREKDYDVDVRSYFDHSTIPDRHENDYCSYDLGWLRLTYVCSTWRKVALATPSLWCDIQCADLNPNIFAAITARSGDQPLRFAFDYNRRPLTITHTRWTTRWLTKPICARLQRLELDHISQTNIASVLDRLHKLPCLSDFSLTLDDWESGEDPPVILHADLPLTSSDQLRRISLCNCFPPLSSPIFSPNLTHLALEVSYYDAHPAIPTVDEMVNLLSTMPKLEKLRLAHIPVPNRRQSGVQDLPVDRPSLVLSCLRKMEYLLTEFNESIPSALELLQRLVLPRGVDLGVEICQDVDKDLQNAMFARVTKALFHTIEEPARAPWRLSVHDFSVSMILYADAREWHVDPTQYLYRQRSIGDTYISNYRSGGIGEIDVPSILRHLPLESLVSIDLNSRNSLCRSPEGDVWPKEVHSARAVCHLAVTLPISPDIFQDLGVAHAASAAGNGVIFPRLESIAIRWAPSEEGDGRSAINLSPTLDALAICAAARSRNSAPLRTLFVDRRLEFMYPWQRLTGIDVTFFSITTE